MWPVPGFELPLRVFLFFLFLDKSKGAMGIWVGGGGGRGVVLYECVSLLINFQLQIYLYVKRKSIHADFHKCEVRFASMYLSK